MGAKAKLLSNFLALGTASLVIESLKFAQKIQIDWKNFYELSSLGSGSSRSLDRIAPQAINNNYEYHCVSPVSIGFRCTIQIWGLL